MPALLPLLFVGTPESCVEALAAVRRGGPVEARLAADAASLRSAFEDPGVAARLSAVVVVPGGGPPASDVAAVVPATLPLLVVADELPPDLAGSPAQAVTLADLERGFDRSGGAAPLPEAAPPEAAPPELAEAPFAYDHLEIGVYRCTPAGAITHANAALAALLGYESPAALVAADVRAELGYPWPAFAEALRPSGAVRDFEARWARRSGDPLVTRENARAARSADGRLLYIDGTIQEVPGPADTPPAASGDGAAHAPAPPPQASAPPTSAPATPSMFNFRRSSEPDAPEPAPPPAPREERPPVPRGPAPMSPVSPLVAATTARPAVSPAPPAAPPHGAAPPPAAPTAQAAPPVIVRAQPAPDSVAMPAMDRHAEEATVVSDAEAGPAILVVEDNNDTRMLLERILRSTYDVTAVGDARSALLAMNERPFAGLVLDINLGGRETGADVLRIARSLPNHAGVFAIALTAYALPGDRERLLEAGFNEYISKPFTRQSLMEALKAGVPA